MFVAHIPTFPLDRFVSMFFYHKGVRVRHLLERFMPDGNIEIIIDLHDAPQYIHDNDSLKEIQACHHVWASGVRTEPITIPSGIDSEMIVILFRRGMAYPFFPFPMDEISDCVVDADLIWAKKFANLRERLLETRSTEERFRLVETFLLNLRPDALNVDPCVSYAVEQIVSQPNRLGIGELNRQIGYSQKHFISMFKKRVGIAPKAYLKIMRFQKAVAEIERETFNWQDVAFDCGFYDQAHFINDFKHFSGLTPEQYYARKGAFLNYIPVE